MKIEFERIISDEAPDLKVVTVEATVRNSPTSDELWSLLGRAASDLKDVMELSDINKRPAIRATREMYKRCGKEPNRYRPSAEALSRRAVKGMELYRINTLVDLINLISLQSGYSIGGFDMDKIAGDTLTLGVGRENEPFEGIGRGELNIAHIPVYRDEVGGVGTPTSDNERTKLSLETTKLLMTINIYGEEMPVDDTIALTISLLERYADATDIEICHYKSASHNNNAFNNPES
ncbi:MAG: phenylalanine--tRNA ligase beta subunit-related protein [Bacteroides sp.]|nr:phenylalanine--tRNA ligase beta subunit-related protein [Bacteroides sp.]